MTFIPTAHAVTKQVVLQLQARLPLLSPGHSAFIIAGPCQKPLGGITGRQHGKHILLIFLARRCSGSSWPCMSSWAILNPTIPETTAACNLTTSAIPVRNSVQLPLLTVIAQVITALDNKRAHYQRSVLDQHIPFFGASLIARYIIFRTGQLSGIRCVSWWQPWSRCATIR